MGCGWRSRSPMRAGSRPAWPRITARRWSRARPGAFALLSWIPGQKREPSTPSRKIRERGVPALRLHCTLMKVQLAYGQGHLPIEVPADRTTVIVPTPKPGLPDERTAVWQALERPIGRPPLRSQIKPGDKVCISFTDITRATPNDRLIPWLLEHLAHVPRENITLLNQLGTHRPNTQAELEKMLTPEVVRNYRVLNHEPENRAAHVPLGTMRDGITPALINRHVVEADVRIVT